jgi:hypothetical protein
MRFEREGGRRHRTYGVDEYLAREEKYKKSEHKELRSSCVECVRHIIEMSIR